MQFYFIFPSNETINTANDASLIGSIEPLSGNNFASWKEKIEVVLGVLDLDYAFRMDEPVAPASNDPNYEEKEKEYEVKCAKWERSNRMSLMIIKQSIPEQ